MHLTGVGHAWWGSFFEARSLDLTQKERDGNGTSSESSWCLRFIQNGLVKGYSASTWEQRPQLMLRFAPQLSRPQMQLCTSARSWDTYELMERLTKQLGQTLLKPFPLSAVLFCSSRCATKSSIQSKIPSEPHELFLRRTTDNQRPRVR
jgi:hypothetical protein